MRAPGSGDVAVGREMNEEADGDVGDPKKPTGTSAIPGSRRGRRRSQEADGDVGAPGDAPGDVPSRWR